VLDNEGALADVVGNMVSNAIKYTKEGGHVKVATRLAGTEAICEVIDDGMGIPEAEKEQVFQEFFRAKNARVSGQEGTGLGLAIVKEIIERYGGRVAIESLENLGTCALFALPVAPAEPEPRSVGA
jgi:signal transduction histidine kinase